MRGSPDNSPHYPLINNLARVRRQRQWWRPRQPGEKNALIGLGKKNYQAAARRRLSQGQLWVRKGTSSKQHLESPRVGIIELGARSRDGIPPASKSHWYSRREGCRHLSWHVRNAAKFLPLFRNKLCRLLAESLPPRLKVVAQRILKRPIRGAVAWYSFVP